MPYPKGIKTPEVRAAWLLERRAKVQTFDQLVRDGLPRYKAARTLGHDVSSIEAMRRSVEQLDEVGHVGRAANTQIDLGLSLLGCLRKPGEILTAHDIAAWCGCSRAAIQAIEVRALRKLRLRLAQAAASLDLADELGKILERRL